MTGIDYDASAIAYCKTNYSAPNIEYVHADASSLSLTKIFDVAISFQVIEHIADIDNFIIQIKKRVKSGGIILITTPNSKVGSTGVSENPFHVNEMDYTEFQAFIGKYFHKFNVYGIGFTSKNRLRKLLIKSPLYSLGKLLKRESKIKKIATRATGMTEFNIIENNVYEEAIDLFAVCTNEQ